MLLAVVRRFIKPYLGAVALVVVLQTLQTVAALTLPDLNARIIDEGVLTGDIPFIWGMGGVMLAVAVVQLACSILAVRFGARAAMAMGRDMRREMFAQVQRFSSAEVGQFGAPSLVTRSTNDVQQVQQVVSMTFNFIVMAPLMMVGGIVMSIRQDPGLSLLLVVAVPLLAVVLGVVMFLMRPLFQEVQRRLDRINLVMREQVTGVRVIRAFVREASEARRFDTASRDLYSLSIRIGYTMSVAFPALNMIIMGSSVAVVWFGAGRIESGDMQVGAMVAFLTYLMQIFISVMMAMMMFFTVPRAEVSAGRIREVLEVSPAIVAPQDARSLPTTGAVSPSDVVPPSGVVSPSGGGRGLDVAARDLTFGYPGAEEPVLQGVDFHAPAGKTTAIIGSTGSGKSTLINLIPRLLDITGGTLEVGGVDVREADLDDLRSRIALVPQTAYLFAGTIASTLRFGNPDATDQDLWRALEVAQARDFVEEYEEGLGARVEPGGRNFSGGQRQRLAIARALVRPADIYLFDDCFSALDVATDARLRAALPGAIGGATSILIAQRVSTVRGADQILVLDAGRVVGVGKHAELMETCETYREIVLSQMSLEEAK